MSTEGSDLAMNINPAEATRGILEATAFPEAATLIEIHQATRLNLPDDVLSLLGGALLPYRDDLRLGPFLDELVTRLAASNWQSGPPELGPLITEERARQERRVLQIRASSRAFLRLERSGEPNTCKIHALHQTLDDRFHREGIEVGFDYDREDELKHMSRPEWVIRTLNCFFCGCENSGRLSWESESGLPLLPELEEVGLTGCVKAFRDIAVLVEQEQDIWTRAEAGELDDEDAEREVERIQEAMEKAELDAGAEGYDACATSLWNYAIQHQLQILPDA